MSIVISIIINDNGIIIDPNKSPALVCKEWKECLESIWRQVAFYPDLDKYGRSSEEKSLENRLVEIFNRDSTKIKTNEVERYFYKRICLMSQNPQECLQSPTLIEQLIHANHLILEHEKKSHLKVLMKIANQFQIDFTIDVEKSTEVNLEDIRELLRDQDWSSIRTLYLSSLELSSLPPEIGKLIKLEKLYLQKNRLESLPPEIGNLQNLRTLVIRDNDLTTIPAELGTLPLKGRLNLSNNPHLRFLPSQLRNVVRLDSNDLFFDLSKDLNKLRSKEEKPIRLQGLGQLAINQMETLERLRENFKETQNSSDQLMILNQILAFSDDGVLYNQQIVEVVLELEEFFHPNLRELIDQFEDFFMHPLDFRKDLRPRNRKRARSELEFHAQKL